MKILLAKLSLLVVAAVSAVGCSSVDLTSKVEELNREREDLQRRNTHLEGQLAAAEAQVASLEREIKEKKPRSAEVDLPDLKDSGVTVRKRGSDTVLDLPSDVFFGSGSSKLSKDGEKRLGPVVDVVRKHAGKAFIRIEGHTDSDPIRRTKGKYHCNWELSFERAHSVVHHLVDQGIDPKHLAIDCYGEHQPQDPKNKSKNRRVEIVLSK